MPAQALRLAPACRQTARARHGRFCEFQLVHDERSELLQDADLRAAHGSRCLGQDTQRPEVVPVLGGQGYPQVEPKADLTREERVGEGSGAVLGVVTPRGLVQDGRSAQPGSRSIWLTPSSPWWLLNQILSVSTMDTMAMGTPTRSQRTRQCGRDPRRGCEDDVPRTARKRCPRRGNDLRSSRHVTSQGDLEGVVPGHQARAAAPCTLGNSDRRRRRLSSAPIASGQSRRVWAPPWADARARRDRRTGAGRSPRHGSGPRP